MSAAYAETISSAQPPFARARAHGAEVEGTMASLEMMGAAHADVEAFAEKSGREWARLILEEHFALRAALERPAPKTDEDLDGLMGGEAAPTPAPTRAAPPRATPTPRPAAPAVREAKARLYRGHDGYSTLRLCAGRCGLQVPGIFFGNRP